MKYRSPSKGASKNLTSRTHQQVLSFHFLHHIQNYAPKPKISEKIAMETRIGNSLSLLLRDPNDLKTDFNSLFNNLNTSLFSTPILHHKNPKSTNHHFSPNFKFCSTSVSIEAQIKNPTSNFLKPATRDSSKVQVLFKNLSVVERALIGAAGGGIAGAFTYVCLLPLDTIKTKLQTKGASEIYSGAIDAFVKTFQSKGILGFYSGISAVIVGSTASSIVSSAIMVPKELITQRMQAGAKGRSWQVLMRILEKDGILGLYAGYSATLLRNLPAGVLSYSSFEYLKAAVLSNVKKERLEPFQSVCCGALAGAISASLTTPLDVVKTRLMTQVHSEAANKVGAVMVTGVSATVRQILTEEGWVGFTRGMGPRVLHSACFSALGYFAFETARLTILDQYLKHKELETLVPEEDATQAN
uniref:Protein MITOFERRINLIKE 1, chloroplastic n=1 Tax=Solanum lycopersicum TaxID=4081 RepID=A0A3Q7G7C0_SOLLC